MTAKEWLGVMQKASDFPKGMEKLIIKYGEMLLEENTRIVPDQVEPDLNKYFAEELERRWKDIEFDILSISIGEKQLLKNYRDYIKTELLKPMEAE